MERFKKKWFLFYRSPRTMEDCSDVDCFVFYLSLVSFLKTADHTETLAQ